MEPMRRAVSVGWWLTVLLLAGPGAAGPQSATAGERVQAPDGAQSASEPRRLLRYEPPEQPQSMPYSLGQPIPEGYVVQERPRLPLLITGGAITGGSYLLTLGLAASGEKGDYLYALVPVLGPVFWGVHVDARRDCSGSCDEAGAAPSGVLVGAVLAAVQAAGLVVLGFGASKERRLVRQDVATITVTPIRLGGAPGIGVAGTF